MEQCIKPIKCVVISGIDGSGKTTVINSLIKELKEEGYTVSQIWLRFNHYFVKPLHALARIFGLARKVNNEIGEVWQHQFYKSKIFSTIYIWATYFDSHISRLKYNRLANKYDIVICDRWIPDILIDLSTKTHNTQFLDSPWAKRFLSILPDEHLLFEINRDISPILECRIENRNDPDFNFRYEMYENLRSKSYIKSVANNGSIESCVDKIKKYIYG